MGCVQVFCPDIQRRIMIPFLCLNPCPCFACRWERRLSAGPLIPNILFLSFRHSFSQAPLERRYRQENSRMSTHKYTHKHLDFLQVFFSLQHHHSLRKSDTQEGELSCLVQQCAKNLKQLETSAGRISKLPMNNGSQKIIENKMNMCNWPV